MWGGAGDIWGDVELKLINRLDKEMTKFKHHLSIENLYADGLTFFHFTGLFTFPVFRVFLVCISDGLCVISCTLDFNQFLHIEYLSWISYQLVTVKAAAVGIAIGADGKQSIQYIACDSAGVHWI